METVTLIGKGGLKLTFLFLGVVLDLYKYVFPWEMCFTSGVVLE